MGLPVVTWSGATHVSRVSRSLLYAIGLNELAVDSPHDYVRCAVALASDVDRLRRLRANLREQMHHAPLCDAQGFVARLENAYRAVWREWCGG